MVQCEKELIELGRLANKSNRIMIARFNSLTREGQGSKREHGKSYVATKPRGKSNGPM